MVRRLRTAVVSGLVAIAATPALILGGVAPAWSATASGPVPVPPELLTEGDPPPPSGLSSDLDGATGTVEVTVRLAEPAIAESVTEGAVAESTLPSQAAQRAKKSKVVAQQESFVDQAAELGATELGRTELVANLVAVTVDASQLDALAALDNVVSVNPISRYETHSTDAESGSLGQAIDYVQAAALHEAGFDGSGVRVAVLDSGIDYTHANLGGPGTLEVYETCFAAASQAATGVCAELFGPSAPKVKGGFDFVGDSWPNSARTEDPNPLDAPSTDGWAGGHGTHVADIIGGRSADGSHQGIAPGVDLYGVKVCSSVSTSCNGVAMLLGMDWALDPNGDGDITDAVDIVNMSLGSSYGQDQDDSSFAAENLVHAGVLVVASAGNSADRPFIVGSPSSAPSVISVAQTALPDDLQWVLEPSVGAAITNAVLQAWSPAPEGVLSGSMIRPTDAGGIGCSPAAFPAETTGKIALIQRGTCNVSDKALFAQQAGAVAAVIYNNAAGDPPSFSFGSAEPVTIPTFSISQSDGGRLATALGGGDVTLTIDPANGIPLTNTMVGTSSRGTTVTDNRAKPDIGAPGAWLSAVTATGTEVANFGGTSGAAPVVTGAAALLLDKFDAAKPAVIKARLLNGADSGNRTPTATGFIPTPITRVGAGEVRVAPAADAASVLATSGGGGNIGLGIPSVTDKHKADVELTLTNTSNKNRSYSFDAAFRDPADQSSGGVSLNVTPKKVTVPKGKSQKVKVQVSIDGAKLETWPFASAGGLGAGAALNGPEFDGWVTATSEGEEVHVGWTVLPRKAAGVSAPASAKVKGTGSVTLKNSSSVQAGWTDVFTLDGTSPEIPDSAPGGPGTPGSNAAVIDLAATGARTLVQGGQSYLQFGIATHDRRTALTYPAEFDVYIDVDRDGEDDFILYNSELSGFALTGQAVVNVYDIASGTATPYFYTIGGFATSTQIFTAPASVLGLEAGETFDYSVYAFDNYFTGALTDSITGLTHTLEEPKYVTEQSVEVPAKSSLKLSITEDPAAGESSQQGLLLLHESAATSDFSVVGFK